MAVPTLTNLFTDVTGLLTTASLNPHTAGPRLEQRLAPSASASSVLVTETEQVQTGSNTAQRIVSVDVSVQVRAADSTLAALATAEATSREALTTVTVIPTWEALTSVSRSPRPEIEVSSEPELIGEVYSFTVRASVVLELEI